VTDILLPRSTCTAINDRRSRRVIVGDFALAFF
jgi:hypothetical protein